MPAQEKRALRELVRERLRQLSEEDRHRAGQAIFHRLAALPSFAEARVIMAFASTPAEPDTRPIIDLALRQGKTVLLPRCGPAPRMEALPYRSEDRMATGPWGIREPLPESCPVPVPEPDLILVPCVAVTPEGLRLGHGAGYYDWFLRGRPGEKICLCFQAQLLDCIPADPHDIPMDRVLWA